MSVIAKTGIVGCVALALITGVEGATQDTAAITGAVVVVLSDDLDLETVDYQVEGTTVVLSGLVPTLWVKTQAIDQVLAIDGVETAASELSIPAVEGDDEIAHAVGSAIQRYRYNTIWDYVEGSVINGVVTLTGSVTPDRLKSTPIVVTTTTIGRSASRSSNPRAVSFSALTR